MALSRRHQAISGTITASGNSGPLPNLGEDMNATVVAFLDVTGSVSGTSATLTVTVMGGVDGARWATIGTFTAVTTSLSGPQRIAIQNVLDNYLQVSWVVSGAGATFNGVTCDLLMSSPDA